MSAIAISVDRLGKSYRIGEVLQPNALLSERIGGWVSRSAKRAAGFVRGRASGADAPSGVFWALRDLSFDIRHGEAIGVIGRNGAGKSTLLKILSRITKPTEGRATLYGRVGSLLEVGTGFHPELSGRDNVFLNGAILGMRRADIVRRFDEIVAFAEVEKFIDTPVKHYSSGMAVRLAFAVAAHLEPEILLVDEVLAVGDTAFQKKCLGKMGDVTREGRTVLLVSHDLTSIQVLCQRALRLVHGEVRGIGPVAGEIHAYLAESRTLSGMELDHPIALSESVRLVRFGASPNPVPSGQPVQVEMALESTKALRVDEAAVIVQDALNRRVGVIDYRRPSGAHRVGPGAPLTLLARLSSLPLVEGEYRLGLSIRTDEHHAINYDVTTLDVVARPNHETVPYSASIRGIVSFDYTIESGGITA